MQPLRVCLCAGTKRAFHTEGPEKICRTPFVRTHICLHLWDACVLLWQPSRPLVHLFVRAPAFNGSGLCHINTAADKREIFEGSLPSQRQKEGNEEDEARTARF